MKVELKSLKINKRLSEETDCFSATLYVDGKRCAEVGNRGCGGSNEYRVLNKELFEKFEQFCKDQPDLPSSYEGIPPLKMNADLYIGGLLEQEEKRKLCKKGIVFRLEGDAKNYFRILSGPYDEQGKAYLRKQYGDKIVEILNEQL